MAKKVTVVSKLDLMHQLTNMMERRFTRMPQPVYDNLLTRIGSINGLGTMARCLTEGFFSKNKPQTLAEISKSSNQSTTDTRRAVEFGLATGVIQVSNPSIRRNRLYELV